MNDKGNVAVIATIIIAIIIVILLFIILIFMGQINSLLYNIKLDMYSINKSAIIAVNKGITSREKFSYDKNAYKEYFKNMLINNYNLNENLENKDGIIQKINIVEYEIYPPRKKDRYSKIKQNDRVIHSVIKVKIKPIILEKYLKDIFIFEIHEDVTLNTLKE